MKALLLSAYDAESHRLWRENLKAMFPLIQWTELILPARYFPWRVRGNSLSWAFNHRATLTDNYDLLLCTSMTDLSALRGFVPELTGLPTIVYFHENQFAYPVNPDPLALRPNPVEPQMLSLYTALCADHIVFNSQYNRNTFLAGVEQLLGKLPDHVPAALMEKLCKAIVIPVPLCEDVFLAPPAPEHADQPDVLTIVWNHRREFDKGPALLLAIAKRLVALGVRFRMHLLGQRFRQSPAEFVALEKLLANHCAATAVAPGHCGYVQNRTEYCRILASADVVLSTALHDFQGLSVLEATALGCTPLAPARLVYPEYLATDFLYQGEVDTVTQAESAVGKLQEFATRKSAGEQLPCVNVTRFRQSSLLADYAAVLQSQR
ncbi:MAG: DUF3524 domain-containing protein [Gammaproteobacteria bacterium]|nr:DUF3524 domain-containing protein [Gammaproteobacteria bacterium]MDP2347567.1 DUF3524 domain-containing protein [Gammaproteobacteria bacterium]